LIRASDGKQLTMREQHDILDERDPIRFPAVGSVLLHGGLVAVVFLYTYWVRQLQPDLGSEQLSGGAYSVSSVKTIPLPQQEAPANPVANDSTSPVPSAPEKVRVEKKVLETPVKNAFEIPKEKKPPKQDIKPRVESKYAPPPPDNQVFSSVKQAVSNPMYSAPAGGGGVGVSGNTVLGTRYGAYAELLRQRITQAWQRNGLDGRSQRDPAIVGLTIMQNGTVRDVRLVQTSGNPAIDNSALRALYQANPLPPLPAGLGASFAVQFSFDLK
jgi:periplasmic protein TonB